MGCVQDPCTYVCFLSLLNMLWPVPTENGDLRENARTCNSKSRTGWRKRQRAKWGAQKDNRAAIKFPMKKLSLEMPRWDSPEDERRLFARKLK